RRELRWLKAYAVVSTAVLATLSLAAFRQPSSNAPNPRNQPSQQKQRFTEIDVERINVVEPDGKYRMVISNRPRSIGPIYKGEPFGYAGGGRPGIIFFNDEGTENGGLTFTGSGDINGRYRASTHMSFDQFDQDQVLNLDYADENGTRRTGIEIDDRANVDIRAMVRERDSINEMSDTAARNAALRRWAEPRNGVPLVARRVWVGRDVSKAAVVNLSDPNGRTRLR